MSEPRFPQGDMFENVSEIERLQIYKHLLQEVRNQLLNADIESLSYSYLSRVKTEIGVFLKYIDNLKKDRRKSSNYFRSIDAIYINVRDALSELAVAQHLLQRIQKEDIKVTEIAENVRQVHRSFMRCQDYLDEALQQFGAEFS